MLPTRVPSERNPPRDGVLNLRKQTGWTSHDVVARLRKSFSGTKIGHAGTLDPAASGVLPVLIGRATRIAEYLVDWEKEYRAVLRLGETTDTLDATGTVQERRRLDGLTESAIHEAVSAFRGRIRQMPPMYSAVKIQGVPLYKSAREGRVIKRAMREVMVHRLEVERIDVPDVHLRVLCSKGTYIRSLCADIGDALHVGGHLLSLQRIRVGPLAVDQAMTVEEAERQVCAGAALSSWLSLDEALSGLAACRIGPQAARGVLHGVSAPYESVVGWEVSPTGQQEGSAESVRIKDREGRLLAIGFLQPPLQRIVVKKLLVCEDSPTCVS